MHLSASIDGYWLDKKREFADTTYVTYSYTFSRLIDFLDDPPIASITSDDIRRFLDYLSRNHKLSKRSVHDNWVTLSSLWTWAEGELQIPHVIRGKIDRPRFPAPLIEPLTQEEIKALIKASEFMEYARKGRNHGKLTRAKRPTAARDKSIILTLLDSGIRAQELCDLLISDYDPKRGRLHVRHGKGDKARHIFLGDRSRKSIWRYLAERGDCQQSDPLFSTKTNEALERNNLRHMLGIIGGRAGVKRCHPHLFRHTFAIQFLRNGGNLATLQQILGHADISTVLVYVKLAESDIEQAGRRCSPGDAWKL